MADNRRTALPAGEFFMLEDLRSDFELLACDWNPEIDPDAEEFRDYTPMPIQYDADPDASFAMGKTRFALIRALYPDRSLTQVLPALFSDCRVRLDENLVLRSAHFRGGRPAQLAHFDWLADYACEPLAERDGGFTRVGRGYSLVSTAWKGAIEALEPGVHQFFPCDLVFTDSTVRGHYVFRPMQVLDFIDFSKSDPGTAVMKLDRGPSAGQYTVVASPRGLAAKREVVRGRHCVKHAWESQLFLSRALTEALLPLLPKRNVALIPVRLV